MRFDVITLFPAMFDGVVNASILKRAQNSGAVEIKVHDMRDVATDNHKTVDDTPYGGGAGMVLKVDILDAALKRVLEQPEVASIPAEKRRSILLCPQGQRLAQPVAQRIAEQYEQLTLICGHYEGYDERFRKLVDAELSIGDYVLTGGELPAMVAIDTVSRLLPAVIRQESPEEESFSLYDEDGTPLIEYPHYTRPYDYNGEKVPDVLLSGNHAAIAAWRLEQAKQRTKSIDETL